MIDAGNDALRTIDHEGRVRTLVQHLSNPANSKDDRDQAPTSPFDLPHSSEVLVPPPATIRPDGGLYVIAGDRLLSISASGLVKVLAIDPDRNHSGVRVRLGDVTSLAVGPDQRLYAGTDKNGVGILGLDGQFTPLEMKPSPEVKEKAGLDRKGVRHLTASGLAFDDRGNLLIASQDQDMVLQLDSQGSLQLKAALIPENPTPELANSAGSSPMSLCWDPVEKIIYALDVAGRVCLIGPRGEISTLAGGLGLGLGDGPASKALLGVPWGIAYKDRRIIIADKLNNRIRSMDVNGNVSTLAGGGPDSFVAPEKLAWDTRNSLLWVTDSHSHAVWTVNRDGAISKVAGSGTRGYRAGALGSADLDSPDGIALSSAGEVYVADSSNHCIWAITGDQVQTLAGLGCESDLPRPELSLGPICDGGLADGDGSQARFNIPTKLVMAPDGNLYVWDSGNECLRMITPGGEVTTVSVKRPDFQDLAVTTEGKILVLAADRLILRLNKSKGFDLVANLPSGPAGKSTKRNATPAASRAPLLAPTADGGVFVLDQALQRLWLLDAHGHVKVLLNGREPGNGAISSMVAGSNGELFLLDTPSDGGPRILRAQF